MSGSNGIRLRLELPPLRKAFSRRFRCLLAAVGAAKTTALCCGGASYLCTDRVSGTIKTHLEANYAQGHVLVIQGCVKTRRTVGI